MTKVRIGVIGCGSIAQIQHLPHLRELSDRFELVAVCDVSAKLSEFIANFYQAPQHFTDFRHLVESDLDAVLLCHTDPKTETAVAALQAGKHVFIEKPMCYSVSEADAILDAAKLSGKIVQVGYMKQHDPGYKYAKEQIQKIEDIRFIQVNHLHPNNALHLKEYKLYRFDDIPKAVIDETRAKQAASVKAAIGEAPPLLRRVFGMLSGSMIHDISSLRGMFGQPKRVVSAETWRDGSCITVILEYDGDGGDKRCVATWADLPNLWDFHETLEVYGGSQRVSIKFPTGFARGLPSPVIVQGMEGDVPWKKEVIVNYQNSFKEELIHFHECLASGTTPITDGYGAKEDMGLVRDIVLKLMENVGV